MNDLNSFQFGGRSFPVHHSYGIVCGFTEKLNTCDHKFNDLPKSLLESFRVINILEPDMRQIAREYLFLVGFGDTSWEFTNKFIGFFRFISISYENNHLLKSSNFDEQATDLYRESLTNEKISIGNIISIKSILKILRLSLIYKIEQNVEFLDPVSIIHICVQNYFSCLLSSDQCNMVMKVFTSYF